MRVVVPRDEVLKERKAQAAHEKPSIIGQLEPLTDEEFSQIGFYADYDEEQEV